MSGLSSEDSFFSSLKAAHYIKNNVRPGDPVFIWGNEHLIAFLSGTIIPTRFTSNRLIVSPYSSNEWFMEVVNDLRETPPVFFVIVENDEDHLRTGRYVDSMELLQQFQGLKTFVNKNYKLDARIDNFNIMKLKQE